MVSADTLIGVSESEKCVRLLNVFNDAYKSPLSLVFIDDVERILDYTPLGPRFSNAVLQTLLVLLRKLPPEHCRLMVIATTCISASLDALQLVSAFHVTLRMERLSEPSEIEAVLTYYSSLAPPVRSAIAQTIYRPIGIKQLLLALEMARENNYSEDISSESNSQSSGDNFSKEQFLDCLRTIGF
jgi:vesicle-fusing ATPase